MTDAFGVTPTRLSREEGLDTARPVASVGETMGSLYEFFEAHSSEVALVYGLSIAAIGATIVFQPRKQSRFELASVLWLFAAYAFLHAPADFIRMLSEAGSEPSPALYVADGLTFTSYLFLFEFGRRLVGLSRTTLAPWVLPGLLVAIGVQWAFVGGGISTLSVLVGYTVRFPAGMMAGAGFYWYFHANRKQLEPLRVRKHFFGAGVALLAWAFFCGVVRSPAAFFPANWLNVESFFQTLGVPVHAFRTACAFVVVWGVSGSLRIFNWEKWNDLREMKESLERELVERARAEQELSRHREYLEEIVSERTEELQRNYDAQTVLNTVLQLSIERIPLDELLSQAARMIASFPWLTVEARAAIYVVDDETQSLVLKAQSGFEAGWRPCSKVRLGQGRCGTVAQANEILYSPSEDTTDMPRDATYCGRERCCVPMVLSNQTLGILCLESKPGQVRQEREEGFLTAIACALAGIIARRRAEETLRTTRLDHEVLVNSIDGIVWQADTTCSQFSFVSRQAERLLGYPLDRWTEETGFWEDHLHPDDRKAALGSRSGAQLRRPPYDVEYRMIAADGREVWLRDLMTFVPDNGQPSRVCGVMVDITRSRLAEQQLLAYQSQLRSLASKLALVEEAERRRIAVELHDRIGQSLALARMKVSETKRAVCGGPGDALLESLQVLIDQIVSDTSSLTFELSPPVLYELGLEAALEWLVEHLELQHGIQGSCEDDHSVKPLDDDVRVLLFQATRELLHNVVKHSKATSVSVNIYRELASLRVDVRDDGRGFDVSATTAANAHRHTACGFGLFSIRERMNQIGGEFRLESNASGTRASLLAPLRLPDEAPHEATNTRVGL